MEQTFKISLDTAAPSNVLRADVSITSQDGGTRVVISAPVEAALLKMPLAQARAAVLQAAVALLQQQSQTLEAPH